MKKIVSITLIIMILIPSLILPSDITSAKTLGDLKVELQKYITDYENNKHQQQLTAAEISKIKSSILSTSREIEQIGKDIVKLNEEIETLNKEIKEKEKQIKELMNLVQVSNGESAYLEYMFGAQNFTDFIYRSAISEQLANYNDKLIKEFNQNIVDNNKKKDELATKKGNLLTKQSELGVNLKKLSQQSAALQEDSLSIDEEIKVRKRSIDMYENQFGCKDNEDIATCGRDVLPPDTSFYRPLARGSVSSNYGLYDPWGTGSSFHYALDFTTSDNNTPVYSAANGVVVAVVTGQSCGRNIVYIQHNINGAKYTTSYWHLRRVNVSVGNRVTKDTAIGVMGGAASDYDQCSTGAHVHFVVATGLYLIDYMELWQFNQRRFDPRQVVNAPCEGVYFKDRITRYSC